MYRFFYLAEAGDYPILAQRDHDRKQAGRNALARQRHARSIDQHSRLHAFLFRKCAQHLFRAGLREFVDDRITLGELY